jgi:hypothetical protein
VRGAVQCELDAFFAHLTRRSRLCRVITASAFSKARSRLRADVFDQLNTALLRRVDDILPDQPRWQGLRVLAADASKVRLTLLDREGRRGVREATLFGLFQPGIELAVGGFDQAAAAADFAVFDQLPAAAFQLMAPALAGLQQPRGVLVAAGGQVGFDVEQLEARRLLRPERRVGLRKEGRLFPLGRRDDSTSAISC